jgi:hypothetical protein
VDAVLAADDSQQRADPDAKCGDGESDARAALACQLTSEVIASALSSLLGMKPCAGQSSIS